VVTAWCHGATGIGLARLGCRDTILRGDAQADREIGIALQASELGGYSKSHSLCHGDTGTVSVSWATPLTSITESSWR
jgi:lantibiotic modifying enzyme